MNYTGNKPPGKVPAARTGVERTFSLLRRDSSRRVIQDMLPRAEQPA
jgi:hypothetical protein